MINIVLFCFLAESTHILANIFHLCALDTWVTTSSSAYVFLTRKEKVWKIVRKSELMVMIQIDNNSDF